MLIIQVVGLLMYLLLSIVRDLFNSAARNDVT